ncbi:thioesterase II family protein [Nocardia sp. IBHARD005]|uniref:thioesterase II family protein n=1 Tax=Nocardia sp. IBHARD005 TaxID=3457765 RepID=UPI0040583717
MTAHAAAATHANWLRGLEDPAPRGRLVCFPHAGGSAAFFHPWRRHLPEGLGLLAVQYPGRADRIREPCATDVAQLAVPITRALDMLPDPLVLFGHSMGATIAHEVARRIGRPITLAVSGRPGPARARRTAWHRTDDATLWDRVRELGGLPTEIADLAELRDLMLPILRADYRLSERHSYLPTPPLPGRVVAMIGDRDPEVTAAEAREWESSTTGGFDQRTYEGDHFYLVPHRDTVVRDLAALVLAP